MTATASTPISLRGDLDDLVDPRGRLDVVATGFTYTEGPAWDVRTDALVFNDVPGDTTYRWSAARGLTVEAPPPTRQANGMVFDPDGRLVVCLSGGNSVVRREPDGTTTVLASHYRGLELNSPNDLAVRAGGEIWFTDPEYGRIPVYGQDRPPQLGHRGVYRVTGDGGEPELMADGFGQPNGICFSPDQSVLYVDDTERAQIEAFDVAPDGRLSGRRVLRAGIGPQLAFEDARRNVLPSGYVDGMKCDELGNVYVTGPGGVWVLTPVGEHRGVVELPEDVANLAWGGPDGLDLFVCCRSFVGKVRMRVRGGALGAS